MYELKTLLPKFDIKLPTCMYEVKPVKRPQCEPTEDVSEHSSFLRNLSQQIEIVLKNPVEMAEIIERQDKVFEQLQQLKDQLMRIRSQFKLPKAEPAQKKARVAKPEEPLKDIVVNAHPNYIPYGLLALQNLWKGKFDIEITVYSHSTVPTIPQKAEEFQEKIMKHKGSGKAPCIQITLIWKNCEHTEMISSPAMYVPIYGEINVLRYLARVGPNEFKYEEFANSNEVDSILDICYQLIRCSTIKGRQRHFKALNSCLQKKKYFGGDIISIADVAVCSTVQRLPASAISKEMTANLTTWNQRMLEVTNI